MLVNNVHDNNTRGVMLCVVLRRACVCICHTHVAYLTIVLFYIVYVSLYVFASSKTLQCFKSPMRI